MLLSAKLRARSERTGGIGRRKSLVLPTDSGFYHAPPTACALDVSVVYAACSHTVSSKVSKAVS